MVIKPDVVDIRYPPFDKRYGIEALLLRLSRPRDYEAENRALVALADELSIHPRNLLQKLVEIALELCRADSAGISILEPDGKSFRWHACAGVYASNLDALMSGPSSPFAVAVAQNEPVLLEDPASLFPLSDAIEPAIAEVLLIPFHDGKKPVGTVWVIAHSNECRFDSEDLRQMTSLSSFASAAYHAKRSIDKSMNLRDFLEKRVDERTRTLSHVNNMLRQHIGERERIEAALRTARNQLEAEVSSLNRLHELGTRLLHTPDLPSALEEILRASIALLGADMGNIQLYEPIDKVLKIAAQQGFDVDFLDHFSTVQMESDTTCARALRSAQRVAVTDVEADAGYAIHLEAANKAGYRSVQSTPLLSRDGTPLGVLSTHFRLPRQPDEHQLRILDLYARQASDFIERLRIAERMQEADKRKDEFIAMLSHELRNPLSAIENSAMLLELPEIGSDKRQWAAKVIQRQSRIVKMLLDDLLDASRLSLGRMTLHKQNVTLASILESAVETTRSLIEAAGHALSVAQPPPSVILHGDPVRLAQIFSNLLSNAAKYTDAEGKIALDVKITAANVEVTVTDNGIGIEPLLAEQIFGMFSQGESRYGRTATGLGIGLALVRSIAELHGGWVKAVSEGPGQGSVFTVSLPLARPAESFPQAAPGRAEILPTRESGAGTGVKPCRILVADDNKPAAKAISMLLERDGHTIHVAHDGLAALQEAERFLPDIMLLDIGMPHLSGYEVARAIRAAPWSAGAYLIAATGWGQEKDKKLAKEAGFDVHLTKPIDFRQLKELVENHMKAGVLDPLRHSRESGNPGDPAITSTNAGFPLSRE
jgi:signal transduction histidine kinase/ActR/RegA family two-component response regulator